MHYVSYEDLLALMPRLAAKIGGNGILEWQTNTEYKAGKLLVYDGQIYKVTTDFTSGADFDDTDLETYTPKGLSQDQLDELLAMFEDE